jgi:hypothetical protein
MIKDTWARMALGEHHRRCVPALVRMRVAVQDADEGVPLPQGTVLDLAGAVDEVLSELRDGDRILVDDAGLRRGQQVASFLGCRLNRLEVAAADVIAAARAGDLPALRRTVLTFNALAAAMWQVQLAVQEQATRRTRPNLRGIGPAAARK